MKRITIRKSHQLKGRLPISEAEVSVVVWGSHPNSTSWSILCASALCMVLILLEMTSGFGSEMQWSR
jgi:hypothetical protein